jgi:hypothetical protein
VEIRKINIKWWSSSNKFLLIPWTLLILSSVGVSIKRICWPIINGLYKTVATYLFIHFLFLRFRILFKIHNIKTKIFRLVYSGLSKLILLYRVVHGGGGEGIRDAGEFFSAWRKTINGDWGI